VRIDECGYIEGYIGRLNIILSAIPRHVLSEHSGRNGMEDFSFRKVYILEGLEGLRTMESRVIG